MERAVNQKFKIKDDITLREFLLCKTDALQLCTFRIGGWISGTAWIDHEDLFIGSINTAYLDKKVDGYEIGTLDIIDRHLCRIEVPCLHIDLK